MAGNGKAPEPSPATLALFAQLKEARAAAEKRATSIREPKAHDLYKPALMALIRDSEHAVHKLDASLFGGKTASALNTGLRNAAIRIGLNVKDRASFYYGIVAFDAESCFDHEVFFLIDYNDPRYVDEYDELIMKETGVDDDVIAAMTRDFITSTNDLVFDEVAPA